MCRNYDGTIRFASNIAVGQSARGICTNTKEVQSNCTDNGWRIVSGTCENCPVGPFYYEGMQYTIGKDGQLGDRIALSCPNGYTGGAIVVECKNTGWVASGSCKKSKNLTITSRV